MPSSHFYIDYIEPLWCFPEEKEESTNKKKKKLLRFAKKSPTSSPGTDIDVGRPNIDIFNILKLQNHNSGTMRRTEMADHSLESLEHMRDRTAA